MSEMKIDKNIKFILETLNKYGKGYIVGGYTRDYLLGIKPKDCDFCTDIDYEKLKIIFKEYSPKEIGKSFGIIQIKYNKKSYEIAKLRKDKEFSNERNEVKIEFINDINEDLKRRDFTVNAIAFDGDEFIYYSEDSILDINNRTLRFVGEGEKRIKEDPLRILRGLRIASEKKLKILDCVEKVIIENISELKRVSIERIQDEIFKMFINKNFYKSVLILFRMKVFEELFPETHKVLLNKDILKYLKQKNKYINKFDLEQKLIILFWYSRGELKYLKLDKTTRKNISLIFEYYKDIFEIKNSIDLKKILSKLEIDQILKLIDIYSLENNSKKIRKDLKNILKRKEPYLLKHLDISGEDIKALGIKNGLDIKRYLDISLDIVLQNPRKNLKNYLINIIKGGNST